MPSYEQWKTILSGERLPAVVVDLDAFDRNTKTLGAFLEGGKQLRLATKSLRVPELIERVLKTGAPYAGLMCFSAEEVPFWRARKVEDLLVAYPTSQPSELKILREAHDAGGDVKLVVDGAENVASVAEAMKGVKRPFPVVIDVDASLRLFGGLVHLGVRRSPVRSARDAAAVLDAIARHPQLSPLGAMAYEAQVAGLGDRNPFKKLMNPAFALIRRLSRASVARLREEIAAGFAARGLKAGLFNGGGTGSMNYAAGERVLTELSAGSGLLCSHLFDYYSNVHFEPACFFALQAARFSDDGYVTCQGGGYVASGEPGWDRLPVPAFPLGAKLVSMEGVGEVQTPLLLPAGTNVRIGDPVLFRHAKAGELAERFNEYLLVSGGRVVERAKTYRGFGLCFY